MIRFVSALIIMTAGCNQATGPQNPTPGERAVPIAFSSGDIRLSGTLFLPGGSGPFPAVVLMGGSGPWRPAHWYFDIIRDSFRSRGIAVAYYDRRGEGSSGGDFDRATFTDLADDAVAAVNVLRAKPEIRASRVGLWGHSMGGWIAGLAASRSAHVAFVITAAGPGVGPLDQTLHARANEDRAAGIAEETVVKLSVLRREIVEYYVFRTPERFASAQVAYTAARTQPWFPIATGWRELQGVGERLPSPATLASLDAQNPDLLRWFSRDGAYDPAPALRSISVPYLAIFGEADPVVPRTESVAALSAAFAAKVPPAAVTIRSYAGANHMIMTSSSQSASGFAAGYLAGMADWIVSVTAAGIREPQLVVLPPRVSPASGVRRLGLSPRSSPRRKMFAVSSASMTRGTDSADEAD
ncbi:MAG TPA: alpha/beta fold hydrolase [Gemmatimonadaceae bacterium]|nr:alpha/beta fold hydrolase [Gemmatimonadaceae bacterium]